MIQRLTQILLFCVLSFAATAGNITFTVDMSCYTGDQPLDNVYVSGSWDGWACANCWALTDNGDGTWSGTFDLPDGDHEFKFQINEWADQENLTEGDACTTTNFGFTNRTVTVVDGATYTAGWSSCDADCSAVEQPVDVTFTVDMSCFEGDLTPGVTLNGSFNGWCGACAPMTDNGDGTWSLTVALQPGNYDFKFTVGNWVVQEEFTEGDPCTVTTDGFTNRNITIPDDGTTYTAAWNSCDGNCLDPVETADVTFIVDMTCYPGDASDLLSKVTINGSFNGWCGACAEMSDNGDGTWSITIPLELGTYDFKFTIGNWLVQEEFVGGESCTATTDGFTNRNITVPAGGMTYTAAWNSCDPDCATALPMELTSFNVIKEDSNAKIEWTTESDDTDNLFVVEYSRDAVNFEEIGTVSGATSRGINNYSFTHYLLANGENYYRLKNIDRNDNIQYSDLRNLNVTSSSKIRITPTVSNSNINIQVDDSQIESVFFIYNILGEKVFEYNIIDTNFAVDVSTFPVGQYIGVVQNGNEQITEKFVKIF